MIFERYLALGLNPESNKARQADIYQPGHPSLTMRDCRWLHEGGPVNNPAVMVSSHSATQASRVPYSFRYVLFHTQRYSWESAPQCFGSGSAWIRILCKAGSGSASEGKARSASKSTGSSSKWCGTATLAPPDPNSFQEDPGAVLCVLLLAWYLPTGNQISWMRSSRVVRAPVPKSLQSWVRSQHPTIQWNLRGRQMKQCTYSNTGAGVWTVDAVSYFNCVVYRDCFTKLLLLEGLRKKS